MSFIISSSKCSYVQEDTIEISNVVPKGFWRYNFTEKEGSFLEKTSYNDSHTKVYGKSLEIADRVIKEYRLNKNDNLGVLFSGGKGLGKSLTMNLIIENLKKDYPIIIVDLWNADLSNFLSHINKAVILMDEFEKVFNSNNDENDCVQKEQNSLLSLFSGIGSNKQSLYLLSCNNINLINDNFIARPGRLRYHFHFDSLKDDVIREYLKENLIESRISDIEKVMFFLESASFVSFDILKVISEELNSLSDTVEDIFSCLNIFPMNSVYDVLISYTQDGKESTREEIYYNINSNSEIRVRIFDTDFSFNMHDAAYNRGNNSWIIDISKVKWIIKNSDFKLLKIFAYLETQSK